MKKSILLFSLLILLSNILTAQNTKVVLKTDFNGAVSYGSIETLITEIKAGKSLRVGWQLDFDNDGKSDLEHWIDADFISILNGHVFNQIKPIYIQSPIKDIPQVKIMFSDMKWTGVIGTNGKLLSRYIVPNLDRIEDEKLQEKMLKKAMVKETIVATMWAIKE